jgi:hypothetical protein
MFPRIARVACTVALGYALFLLPASAADDKRPDWSGYTTVGNVVGEVVKADATKLTLRVTWFVQSGGGNRRPRLSGNAGNFRNPFTPHMSRPRSGLKEEHHDYELPFVAESLVRMKTLPPKLDEKGKRLDYTQKELDALRSPDGVTGYAASTGDLAPGTIVEVILIRDKSIAADKAKEEDLRVKYAIILGKEPTPPKDAKKSDEKKN